MVTARDIKEIQSLQPDEQVVVLSLVKSFVSSREAKNKAQERLFDIRDKHLKQNPMSMDEIDKIIHEEN